MEISAAAVMKLRDRTGMQMMKCKAALTEAGGDMEKAVEILRRQNKDAQNKAAERETAEGRIGIYIDPKTHKGAILELRCESAPVAKSEMFVKLAEDLARHLTIKGVPGSVAEFLASPFIDDEKKTVNERIGEVVGLMRENIKPSRMHQLEGTLGHYIHHDGSVGVLLATEGTASDESALKDVCMHIAARNPMAALREDIPQTVIDKETELARVQAQDQGKDKPANIIEKIAEGKIRTWFAENVLAEQAFVKDEKKTVSQYLAGAGLKIKKFVRLRIGELTA